MIPQETDKSRAAKTLARAEAILAELVSFPSLPGTANDGIVGAIASHLSLPGVRLEILPGPEGDRSNIFASIGPVDQQGYILSGHSDVVATEGQDWASNPFCLTRQDNRLVGRGTSDMKGFVACALAMVPEFLALKLARPIHIAISYDEEIGCRGVGHMIKALPRLCAPPLGCIVGEPSDMRPVLSHKGKHALAITFTGKAGHSSDPGLGVNALYPAAELVTFIRDLAAKLAKEGPFDPDFSPAHSTLQAGIFRGGSALNIIAETARLEFEARTIPGVAPQDVTALVLHEAQAIIGRAEQAGLALRLSHEELSNYPALPGAGKDTLAELMARLTGHQPVQSVSYGTEAGLFHEAGISAVICGPGSIARAHRANEYILDEELHDCLAMMRSLAMVLCRP